MKKLFDDSDWFIKHIDDTARSIKDDYITSRYVGFVAVSAVTVYELAIKKIFFDFSNFQNSILHSFVQHAFRRINGRINLDNLKTEYLPRFGSQYKDNFETMLTERENQFLKNHAGSIRSSYGNIITWRHKYVHTGEIPDNASLAEAVKSYELGKEVIFVLQQTFEPTREEEA